MNTPHVIEGACLLMSDLHLNGGARDRSPLEALRLISDGALGFTPKHVILAGDVFDFNLGYRSTLFAHLAPAYRLLTQLADEGVHLWIFTGNHDPDPCPQLSCHELITVLTGPTLFTFRERSGEGGAQRTALIEHGDLCEARWAKRALCQLARAPWVSRLARLLPPAIALKLAPSLPAQLNTLRPPEALSVDPPLRHTPTRGLTRRWRDHLASLTQLHAPVQLWIMGHFHEPRLISLAELEAGDPLAALRGRTPTLESLIILGDWVNAHTALIIDGASLSFYQYHARATAVEGAHQPTGSFRLLKERAPSMERGALSS